MSYRILVVDDDPAICRVLLETFERQSWHVTECLSGAEALQILTCHRFDLVVLDVFMEPVGGLQVLQSVKKLWPRTLVEIMTGQGTIDLAVEAMKMGADEFVTKPFRVAELTAQVAHLIEQRKPRSHPLARRLDEFVREHSNQPDLSLRVLTGRFQVSERYVCRLFRDELKTTFRSRLRRHRLVRAKELLSSTQLPVREVAEMCGFTHQKRLSEAFMREESVTPRWFRQLSGSD